MTKVNIPTKQQASITLGGMIRQLLHIYGAKNYDFHPFATNDSAKGIHWPYTLKKLTNHWGQMTNEMHEAIGAVNLFFVNSGETYPFDNSFFVAGLMGKKTDFKP